ncbi:4'-phosphopantetheinyl transferase family protein [Neisseria chenwenguii]|uniref:4'-phosphopantetheinyl transferase n=1 Tax=Neisseria chenwenguii TaxID=1853278 RepID=A0A220S176_9NEIS|nr:4'-phosphopantetheinyl transferase superfamily protein [Neisseria chenwenguii]ASK27229.1 4'-phosphopantetheinyl transferase [Neisseria chenwenguii]ROV54826.1 4'-phosphopantetheinyl transferase superfamily protein [Neisseria chenwenguii]
MEKEDLVCYVGGCGLAVHYHAAMLDAADAARVARSPGLSVREDWQVSRVLKHRARSDGLEIKSLSHSKGYAAVLASSGNGAAGVDMENCRNRDFQALAAWTASPEERLWLAARGWLAEDFYALWTLKEALVKACGLDFPAGMGKVGRMFAGGKSAGIRTPAGSGDWHAETRVLAEDFVLTCVWQGEGCLKIRG